MSSRTVADLGPGGVKIEWQQGGALRLQTGHLRFAIRSSLPEVAAAIERLYRDYPVVSPEAFVDFEVGVRRPRTLRNAWRPQVTFAVEGSEPFNPLAGDQGFPLLEWGMNWCVYGLCHQQLTLHAAVLERGGRAVILPAPSGSGKSTLCAALSFGGWRLLSDELALLDARTAELLPLPRPVSLKNQSIEVIRRFAPGVEFGSMVHETSKGTVAHFRPPADAVRRSGERATPAWVVMPRYVPEAPATLRRVEKARAFMHLVENAFNYDVFGAEGFDLIGSVIDRSECLSFEYSSVHEAVEVFSRLADGTVRVADD